MPDLTFGEPVLLPPRPGALIEVRARAARLRRQRLVRAGLVAGSAVAVLAGATLRQSAPWHSLEPTTPTVSATLRPSVRPQVQPSRQPGASVTADPLSTPSPSLSPPATTSATPVVASIPGPPPPPAPVAGPALTVTMLESAPTGGLACSSTTDWSFVPGGWCGRISLVESASPLRWVGATLCRMTGSGIGTILVDRSPRMRVRKGNAAVYDSVVRTWERLGDARIGRSWTVAEGSCATLMSPWDTADDSGRKVQPGDYMAQWDPPDSAFTAWADSRPHLPISVSEGDGS